MAVSRRTVRSRDEEIEDEEEVEETPKRRRPRDEEPEERPAKRRRPAKDDDEDEDERPAKRRRRARDDDDDDDDDEDEPKKGKAKKPVGSVRTGWKGAKENKAKGGNFHEDIKISKDAELVKFLEDEPFASYRQHWVETPPAGIKKKSWICLEDDCPLCDLGDRPRMLTAFNILHVSNGGVPDNKILTLGNKALGQLEAFAEDPKTGPLTKLFWSISTSGKGQSTAYNFRPVKERDLEEDWEIDDVEEIEEAIEAAEEKIYTFEDLRIPTKKQLREVSAGLTDEDDDEDDD